MYVYRQLASMCYFFLYFKKDDSCLCTSTNDSHLYISSDDWCLCIYFFCISRKMTRVYVRPQMTRIYIYQVMTGVYVFFFFLYFKKDDSCLFTSTNDSYLYISSDDWCLCFFVFFVFQERWLVSMYVYKWLVSIYFKWWLVSMDWCLCKNFCITVPKGPLGGASP